MSYSLSRAATINLASYLYLLFASLATTPALIRALGLAPFGEYVLALGILALVTSIDLGLSRSVVYHLARESSANQKHEILISSLYLHLSLALAYAMAISVYYSLPLGLLTFLTYLVAHLQTYPESQGDFLRVNIRAVLIGTGNTFGALILAQAGYRVDSIIYLLSALTFLTCLIFFWPLRRLHMPLTPRPRAWRSILSYGLRSQFGKLVNSLQAQYPKFLLVSNPIALAVFGLSSSLVAKAVGAISQLSISFFPRASAQAHSPKLIKYYSRAQHSLLMLGLLGLVGYEFSGKAIITWWLGDPALAIMVDTFLRTYRYYGLLLLLTPLASTILDSHNRPLVPSLYAGYALLIELATVLLLYPKLGLMAVAYGSVLSLVVMVPVLLFSTQKTLSAGGNSVR